MPGGTEKYKFEKKSGVNKKTWNRGNHGFIIPLRSLLLRARNVMRITRFVVRAIDWTGCAVPRRDQSRWRHYFPFHRAEIRAMSGSLAPNRWVRAKIESNVNGLV
jgi:hypothetical protein